MLNQHTMNIHLKINFEKACRALLKQELEHAGLDYTAATSGNIQFSATECKERINALIQKLGEYGIEAVDDKRAVMVQKTKEAIAEMLDAKDLPNIKISSYLSQKVGENYRTLSQVFSDVCCISIENFIIIHKIERAKKLLTKDDMSLTEIAYVLHYSSVAHLSNQFKKVTGLNPTTFHKLIINKRNYSSSLN